MSGNCIIMSIPPPYSHRSAPTSNTSSSSAAPASTAAVAVAAGDQPREDCRDYLRTGRCKYGASCKYNHPANVQSGGGMKMPIDPSEPMFPVRPNEPICQYYMKHGTCKFGQACKFHHPPQSQVTAALVGGTTVLMTTTPGGGGGGRKNDGGVAPQQFLMNHVSAQDMNGAPVMLQFLPQRPDEQDCIYFLKNGRCKYGATCRYHHPINIAPQRRQDDSRRQRQQPSHQLQQVQSDSYMPPKIQYIGQTVPHTRFQQGSSSAGGGTQMVVTDGNMAFMTVDGSSGKGVYQPVPVTINNEGYMAPSGVPISLNPDHASSSSSIASSYDTANSNLDHLNSQGGEQASSGLWHRPRSQNNLQAYMADASGRPQIVPLGARMTMPNSVSDGSIASRRIRTASHGSASDSSGVFLDANGSHHSRPGANGSSPTPTVPTSNSTSSMAARGWRGDRSPTTMDNSRRGMPPTGSTQYQQRGGQTRGAGGGEDGGPRRGPPTQGRRRSSRGVDDGLSMMTSALLTMMDTPEDVAVEGYDFEGQPTAPGAAARNALPQETGSPSSGPRAPQEGMPPSDHRDTITYVVQGHGDHIDQHMFGGMMMNGPEFHQVPHSHHQYHQDLHHHHHQYQEDRHSHHQYENPQVQQSEENSSWYPNWQAASSVGRPIEGNAESMSVMQNQHAPNSPHTTSNVGLFLP